MCLGNGFHVVRRHLLGRDFVFGFRQRREFLLILLFLMGFDFCFKCFSTYDLYFCTRALEETDSALMGKLITTFISR